MERTPTSSKLLAKLVRFLHDTPANVETLCLMCHGMPEQVLAELHRDDFVEKGPEATADMLLTRAEDHAETLERETRFSVHVKRDGAVVLSTSFRTGHNWNGGGVGTQFDGSTADIIGQMQRHLEAKERLMAGAIQTVLQAQGYVIEQLRLDMQDMRAQQVRVQEREEELRIEDLERIVEEQSGDTEKLMKLLEVGLTIADTVKGRNVSPDKTDNQTKH